MGHQKNQANQTTEGKEAQPQLEPVCFYKHTEDGLKSLILIERVNSSRKPWYVFSLYTGAESKHQFRYIYNQEVEQAATLMDRASIYNSEEYFATAFTHYVELKALGKLGFMQEAVPLTYQFFHTLEANNWGL